MSVEVMKEFTFAAGHRLPNHEGKCRRLHGHTYTVQVVIGGPQRFEVGASDESMVLDFDKIKDAWKTLDILLDHRFLMDRNDALYHDLSRLEPESIVAWVGPPTAESIAVFIANNLNNVLKGVVAVRVYESPSSYAEVFGEGVEVE